MKKQNNQNKLAFGKATVAELNEQTLRTINGGSTIVGGEPTCTGCCCVTVNVTVRNQTILEVN